MANLIIPDPPEPTIEEPPKTADAKPLNGDTTGFGLINWLFDHIGERKPIFLHLYMQYDQDVKIGSIYKKTFGVILLLVAIILDAFLFLVYTVAVTAVIVGITFIFVKGTGILDFMVDIFK